WAHLENCHRRTADRPACMAEATSARRRPGPQQHSWWKGSGMLQTTSTEQRAAGVDRPRSGGSVTMRPRQASGQEGMVALRSKHTKAAFLVAETNQYDKLRSCLV